MKSKALQWSLSAEKNPEIIKKILEDQSKERKVIEAAILKKKIVLFSDYKITLKFLSSDDTPGIMEVHDSKEYFNKNFFALKEFDKIKIDHFPFIPSFLGADKKKKILLREFVVGESLLDAIRADHPLEKEKIHVRKLGDWLARLHETDFQNIPEACAPQKNQEMEKIILSRLKEFIKPNVKSLEKEILKTLALLFKKEKFYSKSIKNCLIHGDFQAANIFIKKDGAIKVMDFDNLQIGNPARDVGRFLMQLEYQAVHAKILKNIFLRSYFSISKTYKNDQKFQKATDYYRAQLREYIIMNTMWGKKIPDEKLVKKLLKKQLKLLQSL